MKNNLLDMMCLDVYLSSLNKDINKDIFASLKAPIKNNINLLSWGINGLLKAGDIKNINILANKYQWKNNIKTVLSKNVYESLVITDLSKKIVWVSDGFTKMTGYDKEFALNKTPSFLQGEKTLEKTKKKIRTKLVKDRPFKEVIINYKKDNTPYKCELHIFPLYNGTKTTHFLALEREVV